MDVEAPPPFSAGSLEEPPDPHDSVRFGVFEDEDDNHIQATRVPTETPSSEGDDYGKENGIPGLTNCAIKKNHEVSTPIIISQEFNEALDSPESSIHEEVNEISRSPNPPSVDDDPHESEDEFGDFDTAPVIETSQTSSSSPTELKTEKKVIEDDDWGDFDSAPSTSQVPQPSVDEEDWGAFGEAPSDAPDGFAGESDNWAADFSAGAEVNNVPAENEFFVEDLPVLEELLSSDDLWDYEEDLELGEDEALHLHEIFDREDPTDLDADHILLSSALLWKTLRVVEEAHALKYQWKTAVTNKNFLRELNIDPEAIGKGSLPPLSVGGVLMPTPASNGPIKRTVTIAPGDSSVKITSACTPTILSDDKQKQDLASSTFDSLLVPPADFDWAKSGLTNPLKGANQSSALLDVDFLSANSAGAGYAVSTLQKDLADLGIANTEKSIPKTNSQPSMLDAIMSSAAAQQKKYRAPTELSLDALALHDQLPDIDYLRASMIMFPIGNSRTGNGI
ncbi:unnamed protein product [Auanema sp. JU1783]|nr:unnamed protein product [Auanema sp. JU1783]